MTAFTIAVAQVMGIPDDQIRVIARGAFLHDIGKMAVPDAILRKPDVLTPDEVTMMREHCYHGYQMLKRIPANDQRALPGFSAGRHRRAGDGV